MLTWLYLPNGCKVQFENLAEFGGAEDEADKDYTAALAYTNRLLALGASVNAPGLEAGEDKEQVGYVLRRDVEGDDGELTPAIALYPAHDKAVKKFLWVYLNTADDTAAFEQATGIKVASMKVWPTKQAPDRDNSAKDFFTAVKMPCSVVYKPNPKYVNETETKFVAKRLFVRWEGVGIPTTAPQIQAPAQSPAPTPASPPENAENAENGERGAWRNEPIGTGATWKHVRDLLKKTAYIGEHDAALTNSITKHAKATNNWQGMTAGQVVTYLTEHHNQGTLREAS